MKPSLDRREFVSRGIASAATVGLLASSTANAEDHPAHDDHDHDHHEHEAHAGRSNGIKPGSTILFQGDSITDAGRKRGDNSPNDQSLLGRGYAFLAAADLLTGYPEAEYEIHNRGISGNKVHQLAARWDKDCLDLKPDVLSILIGVNDIWHHLNGKYDGTVETYRTDYHKLLTRTKEALPEVKLVICEPFVLKTGAVTDKWFPSFDEFRASAKTMAEKFDAVWVPFQSMFDEAVKLAPPKHWAGDGVHPSAAGAALMAHTWVHTVMR